MFMTQKEIEATGTDYIELVSWIANEYREGAVQALFFEVELEAGAHYDEAHSMLAEFNASDLLKEYLEATKTILGEFYGNLFEHS